ncbi:MAG: ATP-binding protein, partial [Pseudorhodoplanes sp.]
ARAEGEPELAAGIMQQVERMRRQIDYHLAHARASAAGGTPAARCHVLTSADALARTMQTLHADRGLTIDVDVSHEHFVKAQREDLEEMLGNLVDNACKWAQSRVVIEVLAERPEPFRQVVRIVVDDDGQGLTASEREQVAHRGRRLDETKPGSGLGLSIVVELATLYGGGLTLGTAPIGGLRAELVLPGA